MNSGNPSAAEIMAAIEQSGCLIKQEVATILESLGFNVKTNRTYEDKEELKSGEIDVCAIKKVTQNDAERLSLYTEIICACENNSSPLVFIQRVKGPIDQNPRPQEYLFPLAEYEEPVRDKEDKPTNSLRLVHPFSHLDLAKTHYYYKESLKTVELCRVIKKESRWEVCQEDIYEALFYPLIKALLFRKNEVEGFKDRKYVWLFFPIVVLAGEIYSLNEKTKSLKKENHITFVKELRFKNTSGDFAIDFVKKDSLKDFIDTKLQPFTNHITEIVNKNPGILLDKHK